MLKANGKPLYIRIIDSENEDVFDGLTINLAKNKKNNYLTGVKMHDKNLFFMLCNSCVGNNLY